MQPPLRHQYRQPYHPPAHQATTDPGQLAEVLEEEEVEVVEDEEVEDMVDDSTIQTEQSLRVKHLI